MANLALSAAVSAASTLVTNDGRDWFPSFAKDGIDFGQNGGSPASWLTYGGVFHGGNGNINVTPNWLLFDLGANKSITEFRLVTVRDTGSTSPVTTTETFVSYGLQSGKFQYLPDGANPATDTFTDAATFSDDNKILKTFVLGSAITARYIRLLGTKSPDNYMRVAEVGIEGTAAGADLSAPVIDSFTATPASQTQTNLNWTAHDEGGGSIANYDLEWSADGSSLQAASGTSGWTNLLNAQNQTSFNHTGLSANQQRFYRLRARDTAATPNVSAWSGVNATTWNVAPSFVTAVNLGNVNINQQTDFALTTQNGNGTRVVGVQDGQSLPTGVSLIGTNNDTIRINRSVTGAINIPLKVTDANGQSGTRTFTATLVDPSAIPPLSSMYAPNANLIAPVEIQFTDTTGATVTEEKWLFGDYAEFSSPVGTNPKHTFLAPGIYKLERYARVNGKTSYETYEIVIGGSPPVPPEGGIIFDEIELDRYYSTGAKGGPEFFTEVEGNDKTGVQQINSRRLKALHRFAINFQGNREDGEFKELLEFFFTRLGGAYGFRFFPYFDNSVDDEEVASLTNATATYKFIKTYTRAGRSYQRRILKPVPEWTFKIGASLETAVAAASVSAYSVDYTTGKITFTTPANLTTGNKLFATGQYCIPMRFETDFLEASGESGYLDTEELRLVELLPKALGID